MSETGVWFDITEEMGLCVCAGQQVRDFPSYVSLHNESLAVVSGAHEEEVVYDVGGGVAAL